MEVKVGEPVPDRAEQGTINIAAQKIQSFNRPITGDICSHLNSIRDVPIRHAECTRREPHPHPINVTDDDVEERSPATGDQLQSGRHKRRCLFGINPIRQEKALIDPTDHLEFHCRTSKSTNAPFKTPTHRTIAVFSGIPRRSALRVK